MIKSIVFYKNIVFIGMPGCGKSSIGKIIAEKLEKNFIDADDYLEEKFGSIKELFEISENFFRQKETIVSKELSVKNDLVIATGGGIITRDINMQYLKQNGIIIFIDRPVDMIISDIDHESRPLLKDDKNKIHNLYNNRYELYKKYADIHIKNIDSLEKTCSDIIKRLEEKL